MFEHLKKTPQIQNSGYQTMQIYFLMIFQATKSTYKNRLCFYTKNKMSGKEIKKTVPFMRASEKVKKYLGI